MGKGNLKEMLSQSRQLAQQRRWDEAISVLEEVISLDDECMDAWLEKGKLLNRLGRIEEALEVFDTMIGFAPQEADWWYQRGLCLTRLGRNEEALQAFREASRLNPEDGQEDEKVAAGLFGIPGPRKTASDDLKVVAEFQNGTLYTSQEFEYIINLEFTWNDGRTETLETRSESARGIAVASVLHPHCVLYIDVKERVQCNYPTRDLVCDLAVELVTTEGKSWFYVFPHGQVPACSIRNPQQDGNEVWYEIIATDRFVYQLKRIVMPGDELTGGFATQVTGNFELISN
ncbi:MAG: tetratricopeptide repeat protein [Dehalococcoidia bacterium]